jgi:hypothetical protein
MSRCPICSNRLVPVLLDGESRPVCSRPSCPGPALTTPTLWDATRPIPPAEHEAQHAAVAARSLIDPDKTPPYAVYSRRLDADTAERYGRPNTKRAGGADTPRPRQQEVGPDAA